MKNKKKKISIFWRIFRNNIEDTSVKLENKIQKLNEGLRNLKHTNSENFDSFSEQVQIQGTLNWMLKFLNNIKNIIK